MRFRGTWQGYCYGCSICSRIISHVFSFSCGLFFLDAQVWCVWISNGKQAIDDDSEKYPRLLSVDESTNGKGDWLCVLVFEHSAVISRIIHDILPYVHFSLNSKAAFYRFSRQKLSSCFFSKTTQSRLHLRLSKQGIPFHLLFIAVVITDFR